MRYFRAGVFTALRLHPVEMMLVLFGCVSCLGWYGCGWTDERMKFLLVVPLAVLAALTVNLLAGRGPWRKLYWVCWTPFVPLALWSGLGDWATTLQFFLTLGVLAPLALSMARLAIDNRRFVSDALVYLRSALLSLFFANVMLGLFGAILFSTAYIFGLEGSWIDSVWTYALILAETLLVPLFFFVLLDLGMGGAAEGTRLLDVLLNWIVSPALLIYLGILWIYILKIVATWTLPEGGVAYMVFGYTLFALLVKALREALGRRAYDWFYDRFSLFALPPAVLFWVGALRRVNEYGLTEPRVWLLVCGGLMTLCLLLFLSRRTGRYLWICLAAFVCFAAVAYVPALDPERLAVRSQAARATRIARDLGRLAPDGTLSRVSVSQTDTVRREEYRSLYEALDYIEYRDTVRFAAFGLKGTEDLLADIDDPRLRHYVEWGYDSGSSVDSDCVEWGTIEAPLDRRIDIRGYGSLYTNLHRYGDPNQGYSFVDDTLRICVGRPEPLLVVSGRELLDRQLAAAGCSIRDLIRSDTGSGIDSLQKMRFLDYTRGGIRILFDCIQVKISENESRIDEVSVDLVLVRE